MADYEKPLTRYAAHITGDVERAREVVQDTFLKLCRYRTAQENFIRGGTNRVILATDGDFNVGITNRGDLTRLIEEKAKSGIYLSALGFGMGNLKDATLELLAKNGHGNYAYIDTLNEAQKVLVEQISATLVLIAKDVKIQVEFNPRHVSAYPTDRLRRQSDGKGRLQ
jgi:secreted protein with Ig-like and vWFA domain